MTRMAIENQKHFLIKVGLTSRTWERIHKATSLITNTLDINRLSLHARNPVIMWKRPAGNYNTLLPAQDMAARHHITVSIILMDSTNKQHFTELLRNIIVQGNAIAVANRLETFTNTLLREYDIFHNTHFVQQPPPHIQFIWVCRSTSNNKEEECSP